LVEPPSRIYTRLFKLTTVHDAFGPIVPLGHRCVSKHLKAEGEYRREATPTKVPERSSWQLSSWLGLVVHLWSFAIGLDLQEVDRLLLAKCCWVHFRRPVRNDQFCGRSERFEDLPVIGDPYRVTRLWGGIHFHEGSLGIELDPFQNYAADEWRRFLQWFFSRIGQILVVAGIHLHGILSSRLEIVNGL